MEELVRRIISETYKNGVVVHKTVELTFKYDTPVRIESHTSDMKSKGYRCSDKGCKNLEEGKVYFANFIKCIGK